MCEDWKWGHILILFGYYYTLQNILAFNCSSQVLEVQQVFFFFSQQCLSAFPIHISISLLILLSSVKFVTNKMYMAEN